MTVIAEGVETQGQADAITELGCDLAQGYLFGRPMRLSAITKLLASRDDNAPNIVLKRKRRRVAADAGQGHSAA